MRKLTRSLAVMILTGAFLTLAAPAFATTFHFTEDVTGDVFECEGGDYTITGGTLKIVIHEGSSASGNENFTGTVTPQHVTLTDGEGGTYSASGAVWFGGTFNNQNGEEQGTFTFHINIIQKGGGVVDRVAITAHFSSDGANFFFDKSTCIPPE